MPFLGSLNQADGYTLEVKNTPEAGITILNIRRDRISEAEILVVKERAATDPLPATRPIASNVGRLVFLCSAQQSSAGLVVITQTVNGTKKSFEVGIGPDASIVFDIA